MPTPQLNYDPSSSRKRSIVILFLGIGFIPMIAFGITHVIVTSEIVPTLYVNNDFSPLSLSLSHTHTHTYMHRLNACSLFTCTLYRSNASPSSAGAVGAVTGFIVALYGVPAGYFIAAMMGIMDLARIRKSGREERIAVTTIVSLQYKTSHNYNNNILHF